MREVRIVRRITHEWFITIIVYTYAIPHNSPVLIVQTHGPNDYDSYRYNSPTVTLNSRTYVRSITPKRILPLPIASKVALSSSISTFARKFLALRGFRSDKPEEVNSCTLIVFGNNKIFTYRLALSK